MCPIEVKEKKATKMLKTDEHPRPQSNPEQLAKLSPVFKKNGATNQILVIVETCLLFGSVVGWVGLGRVVLLWCFVVAFPFPFAFAFAFVLAFPFV
jgi:acetyl-CoA acetyltransferase